MMQLTGDATFLSGIQETKIDWDARRFLTLPAGMLERLLSVGLAAGSASDATITDKGVDLFAKLLLDIPALADSGTLLDGRYRIEKLIAAGKNSFTFLATHVSLSRKFALKVIRPGKGADLLPALSRIGQVDDAPNLVQPTDVLTFHHKALNGDLVPLRCVLFPFQDGCDTLQQFLESAGPVSPYFILAFLRQVGTALSALEKRQLWHGDLHAGNILVRSAREGLVEFFVIDVSCGINEQSEYEYASDDFSCLKEHLWRALELLQAKLPRMSIQKHLGARLYTLVQTVLAAERMSFQDMMRVLANAEPYCDYMKRREAFITQHFRKPTSIGLLRYEEITDQRVALSLFEPYHELLRRIEAFGNAIIYGHRGSGKSTYLAILACYPEVDSPYTSLRDRLGILFPCRQGEFKLFSSSQLPMTVQNQNKIRHIIILRILRRIVDTLRLAVEHERLATPSDLAPLYAFFRTYVAPGTVLHYDETLIPPLENLHASLLRDEIIQIDGLFLGISNPSRARMLQETNLIDFMTLLRSLFPELSATRLYLMFDDAGAPNVPPDTQRIINDIIRCTNSDYCVKVSAERFTYDFADTTGKPLEESHDYTTFDISSTLCLGSGFAPERAELKEYFTKIIARRLVHFRYHSTSITDYLGDVLVHVDELVARLHAGRRNAYYCGWDMIWQLGDRTTRNLLELVSAVFGAGGVTPTSPPSVVPARIQHRAVRAFSERKLRALSYVPGETYVRGKKIGLGTHLYEVAATIGKVAKAYLTHRTLSTKGRKRYDERLAIERNDIAPLSDEALEALRALIRFGILDDSKLVESMDDRIKKPIYILNRVFCPVFGISFRRDSHLRLSKGKFELLLTAPGQFRVSGTSFLSDLEGTTAGNSATDLFDYGGTEHD